MQQQQINLDKNVTIEFTPAQLSVVVSQLQKGSFEMVAGVIGSIEQQVIKQVQESKNIVEEITEKENVNGQLHTD